MYDIPQPLTTAEAMNALKIKSRPKFLEVIRRYGVTSRYKASGGDIYSSADIYGILTPQSNETKDPFADA